MPQPLSPQVILPQPELISPAVVSSPKVADTGIPVTERLTLDKSFHWLKPQVRLPQVLDIGKYLLCYYPEILRIAAVDVAAGNWIVNVPEVAVLSAPKSNTATAASVTVADVL